VWQLHAVAHRNHHFAPGVVEAIRDGCELGRRFAGSVGGAGGGGAWATASSENRERRALAEQG